MRDDVGFLIDRQGLQRDSRRDRMTAISITMRKCADLAALVDEHIRDLLVDHQRRDRHVGGRKLLGATDHVGLHPVGF
ncbi:hypothetical protein D3C78_1862300 [compost metagenome]